MLTTTRCSSPRLTSTSSSTTAAPPGGTSTSSARARPTAEPAPGNTRHTRHVSLYPRVQLQSRLRGPSPLAGLRRGSDQRPEPGDQSELSYSVLTNQNSVSPVLTNQNSVSTVAWQDYNTATLTCSNNTTATASSDTEADTCSEQDPAHVLYDCIKSDLQVTRATCSDLATMPGEDPY